jgi:hypothetical protein
MANQVQKLSYVDAKLGVGLPGQQTTRVIYDSVTPLPVNSFLSSLPTSPEKPNFRPT